MTLDDFLKSNKIVKIYAYHDKQISEYGKEYGWVVSEIIDYEKPVIISYESKSKKVSDEDREWSDSEGKTASNLECYRKFFNALTSVTPLEFLETWSEDKVGLEEYMRSSNPNYREHEGLFLLNIANLMVNGKRFSQFGRVFKVIEPTA